MLRIPHIRKHTPQSSQQTRRSVHKRVHVFHANVTHHNHPGKPSAAFTNAPASAKTSHIQGAHGAPSAQRSTRNNRSIQAQVNTLPPVIVKHSKKSPRGVQRGRGFAAPLRFSYLHKKILRPFATPNETQYFSKVFFYILLLNNTYSVHALDFLEFI